MKRILAFILTLLFLFSLYVLFFQTNWLGIIIFKTPEFPIGTIVSWLMVQLLALLMLLVIPLNRLNRKGRILHLMLLFNVILGFYWGFISYFLAGNWAFTFQNGGYFKIWIFYSALIILIPVAVILINTYRKMTKK